jgi:hypothetical protein
MYGRTIQARVLASSGGRVGIGRPVARRRASPRAASAWFKDPSKKLPPAQKVIADNNVIFGYLYHSGALIPEEGFALDEAFENPHEPSGCPGARHMW